MRTEDLVAECDDRLRPPERAANLAWWEPTSTGDLVVRFQIVTRLVDRPDAASLRWDQLIERATGSPFSPTVLTHALAS